MEVANLEGWLGCLMMENLKTKSFEENKSLGLYCWYFMWNGGTWMGTLSSRLLSLQMLACDSLPAIIRVNDVVVMFQVALSVEGKFIHSERTPWLPKRSITSLWKKSFHICILGSLNYVPEIIWFFLDTSCFVTQHPMTTAWSPSMKIIKSKKPQPWRPPYPWLSRPFIAHIYLYIMCVFRSHKNSTNKHATQHRSWGGHQRFKSHSTSLYPSNSSKLKKKRPTKNCLTQTLPKSFDVQSWSKAISIFFRWFNIQDPLNAQQSLGRSVTMYQG